MEPITVIAGAVSDLDRSDVDTDQIIPKQFLKRIERSGFGEFLFFDWRRMKSAELDPSFALNQPKYEGASILVAGANFGCGSSREHAVWALRDFGFRAILAPSFADIFANNCVQNGLLTVTLGEAQIAEITSRATASSGYELTVDLERCCISSTEGFAVDFHIDEFTRKCLLNGLDEIGLTLQYADAISSYEARMSYQAGMSSGNI